MNEHCRRRTSSSRANRGRRSPGTGRAPQRPWPLESSSSPSARSQPWPLDDRLWEVFRLDEDDSPDCPDEGDFWIEAEDEE